MFNVCILRLGHWCVDIGVWRSVYNIDPHIILPYAGKKEENSWYITLFGSWMRWSVDKVLTFMTKLERKIKKTNKKLTLNIFVTYSSHSVPKDCSWPTLFNLVVYAQIFWKGLGLSGVSFGSVALFGFHVWVAYVGYVNKNITWSALLFMDLHINFLTIFDNFLKGSWLFHD